jgi:hypothetical protein
MPKKRKTSPLTSDYKPVFTSAEYKLMQNYGVGDLMDEIGLIRILLLRTVDKMNQVQAQLTYRDYLDTVRAAAYSTGRIANLLERRERLSQPYLELEKQYREYCDQANEFFEKIGVEAYGHEKWDAMFWEAMQLAIDTTDGQKRNKSGKRRPGDHNEQ